jgi:hypothetical protein
MKNLILALMVLSISTLSQAGDLGGFHCSKKDANGEATLSFVPTSKTTDVGVMVIKLPHAPTVVIHNAQRSWSGSMFLTEGNGVFVQGPGNGVPDVSLLNKDGSANSKGTFDYQTQCKSL